MEIDEESRPIRDVHQGFSIFIAMNLAIIPVLLMNSCGERTGRNQDARRTRSLMWALIICNMSLSLLFAIRDIACTHCTVISILLVNNRQICRGINLIFLVHRAKLVQGMSPILSKKWFEKILPISIAVGIALFMFAFSQGQMGEDIQCILYADSETFGFCWNMELSHDADEETKVYVTILLSMDCLVTALLLPLFVVPLYRVYRTNLGRMNENQLKQRLKLKSLLMWSVILTFINQVTSTLPLLFVIHRSSFTMILYWIGIFDPPINVWTSWLMVTRNRRYLQNKCCCSSGEDIRRRSSIAISNISSRTNSRQFFNVSMRSQSTIELPVPSIVPIDKVEGDSKAESMLQT